MRKLILPVLIIGLFAALAPAQVSVIPRADRLPQSCTNGQTATFSTTTNTWSCAAASGVTFVRKTANETVNNNATIQADDELLLAVGANEVWQFELNVLYTTTIAADWKGGLKFPTTPTEISYTILCASAADAVAAAGVTSAPTMLMFRGTADAVGGLGCGGDTTVTSAVFSGFLRNGANAGNIVLWWAQSTLTVTDTIVLAGSWLKATRTS